MPRQVLGNFDLNLLVVFDAVMAEGSVKKAAQRLGMKSPAVSQTLSRLRETIGDELFIRVRHGLKPTPRAMQMAEGIRAALTLIRGSLRGNGPFDPNSETRTILIDMPAGADALVMPELARRMAAAHGLEFRVSLSRAFNVLNDLRFGDCWLAMDYRPVAEPGYRCEKVSEQRIALIARPSHPLLRQGLTAELYSGLPHVALASARTTSVLPVNELLEASGLRRNVTYMVPSLAAVVEMVTTSDLVCSLPVCTIESARKWARLDVFELPFDVPKMPFYLVWHERFDSDTAHAWLRDLLRQICAGL